MQTKALPTVQKKMFTKWDFSCTFILDELCCVARYGGSGHIMTKSRFSSIYSHISRSVACAHTVFRRDEVASPRAGLVNVLFWTVSSVTFQATKSVSMQQCARKPCLTGPIIIYFNRSCHTTNDKTSNIDYLNLSRFLRTVSVCLKLWIFKSKRGYGGKESQMGCVGLRR